MKRKPTSKRKSVTPASWKLPPIYKPRHGKDGVWTRQNGEPRITMLTRHANDNTLSCSVDNECCGCGLRHLYTYNVLRSINGQWYLINRPYAIEGTAKLKERK